MYSLYFLDSEVSDGSISGEIIWHIDVSDTRLNGWVETLIRGSLIELANILDLPIINVLEKDYYNATEDWIFYHRVNSALMQEMKQNNQFDRAKSLNPLKITKTYLMKDSNTSLYKIGKSKNPKHREKTLQGEKPTIKMVKVWNKNIESELHKKYATQRVRGEWFDLTPIQVKYICTNF